MLYLANMHSEWIIEISDEYKKDYVMMMMMMMMMMMLMVVVMVVQ